MNKEMNDIFGPNSDFEGRVFWNYDQLLQKVNFCKEKGLKVVLTSGTFDLFHVGHSRYLEAAKKHGDILLVGIDSDEKVRKKKGPHRPIVPEKERIEIICHSRHVDLVFLKQAGDAKWGLIKVVTPDILITSKRVYKKRYLTDLDGYCGNIQLLESQATTSTTAKIRCILISPVEEIKKKLREAVEGACSFLDSLTGEGGVS